MASSDATLADLFVGGPIAFTVASSRTTEDSMSCEGIDGLSFWRRDGLDSLWWTEVLKLAISSDGIVGGL